MRSKGAGGRGVQVRRRGTGRLVLGGSGWDWKNASLLKGKEGTAPLAHSLIVSSRVSWPVARRTRPGGPDAPPTGFQSTRETGSVGSIMGRGEASSKKVITREQWEKKLASIKVKKEDMNKLVMNFLVTEGYLDAAKLFQEESGTEMHADEKNISERMHIRKALQSGDVEGAIDKVNDLNPGILEDRDHLFFHLQQQKLIELIREKKVEDALEFAQEYLAPKGEENEAFLEELEKTVALLAFEDASSCPIKDLLEFSQRQKTAGELNSAILASQGKEREPRLPGLLRLLTWAQQKLDEKAVYPRINDLSTGKLEDPPLE